VLSDGAVAGGEWWRLVTPIFLHAGILHFFFNSYLLIQLGPLVEELWGTARFWVIYLACGLAGSATSQLPRFVVTVGASGAIMGLMGLLVVHGVRHGSVLGQSMKQLLFRLVAYSLLLSLLLGGRIDHLNHVGGFAAGALLALIVPTGPFRGRAESGLWQSLSLAAVMLVLYAFYQVAAQGRLAAAL
jgi:rhomboid protease GluP